MSLTLKVFLTLLEDNKPLQNREIADKIDGNIRSVQRSIDKIAEIFDQSIVLNRYFEFSESNRAHTVNFKAVLKEEQILLLSKLLISSRSLNKSESDELIDSMLKMTDDDKSEIINSAINSERLTDTYIGDKSDRQ